MQNKRYVILAVAGIFIALIVAVSLENRAHDKGDFSSEQSTGKPTPRSTESAVENEERESRGRPSSFDSEILARYERVISIVDASVKGKLGPDDDKGEGIISWFEGLSSDVIPEALRITLRAQAETIAEGQVDGRSAYFAFNLIILEHLMPKLSNEQALDIILEDYEPGKEYISEVYERAIEAVILGTSNKSLLSVQPYIRARKDDPPWNLIEMMYLKYSVLALEAVAPIYVSDEELSPLVSGIYAIAADINYLEYSEPDKRNETIAKYLPIVEKCAKHDEWSLRVYAAATLKVSPSMRTPELLRRLGNDKVEVVRKIIRTISEEEVPEGRFD